MQEKTPCEYIFKIHKMNANSVLIFLLKNQFFFPFSLIRNKQIYSKRTQREQPKGKG